MSSSIPNISFIFLYASIVAAGALRATGIGIPNLFNRGFKKRNATSMEKAYILPTNVSNKIELKNFFYTDFKRSGYVPVVDLNNNLHIRFEYQYLYITYRSHRPCFSLSINNNGTNNHAKNLPQITIKELTTGTIINRLIPQNCTNYIDQYDQLNGCFIIMKEWKNESFPFRERNKEIWTNFLSLVYSRQVNFNFEVHYLGKLDLSPNDKFFETNIIASNYKLPQLYLNNLRYYNISEFFNKIKKLFFERDQIIDFQFYQHKLDINHASFEKFREQCDWYYEPDTMTKKDYPAPRPIAEREEDMAQFVMFKPNGYYWIKKVFDLIGRPIRVTHIFVLQSKDYPDYIKFFYPFCHSRPYGLEWYSYLQERPLIFVRFICDISIAEFNWIKNTARTLSKFIWTKNIMHCYENEAEKELMRLFFNKLIRNKILLDKEWQLQIDKIENSFKTTTYSYKILSNIYFLNYLILRFFNFEINVS